MDHFGADPCAALADTEADLSMDFPSPSETHCARSTHSFTFAGNGRTARPAMRRAVSLGQINPFFQCHLNGIQKIAPVQINSLMKAASLDSAVSLNTVMESFTDLCTTGKQDNVPAQGQLRGSKTIEHACKQSATQDQLDAILSLIVKVYACLVSTSFSLLVVLLNSQGNQSAVIGYVPMSR